MKNRGFSHRLFLGFFYVLFLFCGVRTAKGAEDRIIAIVNDEVITESELKNSKIFPHKSISFLIEKKLQLQTANKKGISVSPSEISSSIDDIKRANSFLSNEDFEAALSKQGVSIEDYKRDLNEQLTLLKLLNKDIKTKITVSDEELEGYYSLNKNLFSRPEEVRIGYIFFPLKPNTSSETVQQAKNEINNILLDLKNNKAFSDIKKYYSENTEMTVVEDLGYIKRGDLLKEIDRVAFNQREGELSDIIVTPVGFYIVKVLEKKGKEYVPFSDVKEVVRERLFQEKNEKFFKKWLFNIKTSSYIEIKT